MSEGVLFPLLGCAVCWASAVHQSVAGAAPGPPTFPSQRQMIFRSWACSIGRTVRNGCGRAEAPGTLRGKPNPATRFPVDRVANGSGRITEADQSEREVPAAKMQHLKSTHYGNSQGASALDAKRTFSLETSQWPKLT